MLLLPTTVTAVVGALVFYYWFWIRQRNTAKIEHGKPFHLPIPEEALPHWKGKRLTPLSLVSPSDHSKTNIQCYCPATGQYLGVVKAHTREDINNFVELASEAQLTWKKTTFSQRRRVLGSMTKYLIENQTEVARVACRDSGKTMVDAALGEIMVTLEKIKWITQNGEAALAPSKRPRSSNPLLMYKAAKVVYEPRGVVAALVSWNYPLHNLLGPVVASIFSGNGIVVKCSEQVAWSSQFFVQIAKKALSANGFSPNLVQLVCCWGPDANYVTAHPKISHVTFIGSGPVAQQVILASSGMDSDVISAAIAASSSSSNTNGTHHTASSSTSSSGHQEVPHHQHTDSTPNSIKDKETEDEVLEIVNEKLPFGLGTPFDARQARTSVSSQMSAASYKSFPRENSLADLASLARSASMSENNNNITPSIGSNTPTTAAPASSSSSNNNEDPQPNLTSLASSLLSSYNQKPQHPRTRFPHLVLELGGKDPAIVLDDVKDDRLKEIASVLMRGTFQNAGQNCIGIERVIALPQSYTRLEPILEIAVKSLRVGSAIDQQDGVDMGATISDNRFGHLEKLITSAVEQGATLVCGGARYVHTKYPQAHYFAPTLLTNVTRDMDIAQQEVFAPILLLMKAESVQDAVDIANSTEYGLGASVFGSSQKTMWAIADQLECGSVAINDFATYALCQLPFGGAKGSGYGKFGGKEGLRGLCLEKSICYDRLPMIKTVIPAKLDYPIPDVVGAWEMVKSINEVGYGSSLWGRIKALTRLAR